MSCVIIPLTSRYQLSTVDCRLILLDTYTVDQDFDRFTLPCEMSPGLSGYFTEKIERKGRIEIIIYMV